MRVLLYTNPIKDTDMSVAKRVIEELKKHDIEYSIVKDQSQITLVDEDYQTIVVTLGGDGTILHSISNCIKYNIPIFGINVGNLGFLTEIEVEHIAMAMQALKQGMYGIEKRRLLQMTYDDTDYVALNEVLFFRNTNRLILLKLTVSDVLVDNYTGDGFIVSTPTGSTAYSLSCGGSIINPECPVLALTPVNAHTLRSRPLIVGDHNIVQVSLASNATADIIVDGKQVATMDSNAVVNLTRSKLYARFVRIDGCDDFYKKLAKKLKKP